MAGSIFDWSTTPGDNDDADGDINFAEGQAPSTVNNSARQVMGRVAEFVSTIGGAATTGGSANAQTLTVSSAFTTHAMPRLISFKAGYTNTGAVTLNVNSVGAKAIRKITRGIGESALAAGDIVANGMYIAMYDTAANSAAGAWILQVPAHNDVVPVATQNAITASTYAASGDPAGLRAVLKMVSLWNRAAQSEVLVTLATGEHEYSKQILINVDGTATVRIKGTALTSLGTASSVTVSSASGAGLHTATFAKSSGSWSGISADEYVDISGISATEHAAKTLEGIWKVTAVSGGNLTVLNTDQNADISSLALPGTATIKKYNTLIKATGTDIRTTDPIIGGVQLEFNDDPGLVDIISCGTVYFENIAFINASSDADAHGMMLRRAGQKVRTIACGFYGWADPQVWALFESYAELNTTKVCGGAGSGPTASYGAGIVLTSSVCNGNVGSGARGRDTSGFVYAPSLVAKGNATGISSEGPSMTVTSAFVGNNKTNNITLTRGAFGDLRGTKAEGAGVLGLNMTTGARAEVSSTTTLGGGTTDFSVSNGSVFYSDSAPTFTTYSFLNANINGVMMGVLNEPIVKTSAFTLTNSESGLIYTNTGAGASRVDFSLPTAVTGYKFTFINNSAGGTRVIASTGDTLNVAGSVSSSAGSATATTIGACVEFHCLNGNQWIATASQGSWTMA